MNPEQILTRLKALTSALSPSQLATLAVTFVAVVGLVAGSAYWLNSASYQLLYSDMDPEAAAALVSQLRAKDVPFRLDEGGRAVRVPSSRIDELRLELAGEGLPSSGRIGFEIFDRTAFGVTEFLEHVNYRRALEGEIGRTIATLAEVRGARVHIALAKESLFGARAEPAKASVVLTLRNNRPLAAQTAASIQNLVAASVEGLQPDAVVLVDSFGRPLAAQPEAGDSPGDALQAERQQRLERELSAKVVALLEPVVGPNRVRVNVAARLTQTSEEETEELWDPESAVVRSRQTLTEVGASPAAGGVAGARANLPAAAAENEDASASRPPPLPNPPQSGSETTNYEISKVVRHTVRPRGEVARLSVAVIVDDEHAIEPGEGGQVQRTSRQRTPEEIQKIHGLVAAAVGLDPERGDRLTVENIAFDEPAVEEPPPPDLWQRYGPQLLDLGRIAAVVVLGAMAFLVVVRPVVRRAVLPIPVAQASPVLPQQLPRTVEDLEGEIEAELEAALASGDVRRRGPILTKRLTDMTQREPESAARLLRTWLSEETR